MDITKILDALRNNYNRSYMQHVEENDGKIEIDKEGLEEDLKEDPNHVNVWDSNDKSLVTGPVRNATIEHVTGLDWEDKDPLPITPEDTEKSLDLERITVVKKYFQKSDGMKGMYMFKYKDEGEEKDLALVEIPRYWGLTDLHRRRHSRSLIEDMVIVKKISKDIKLPLIAEIIVNYFNRNKLGFVTTALTTPSQQWEYVKTNVVTSKSIEFKNLRPVRHVADYGKLNVDELNY